MRHYKRHVRIYKIKLLSDLDCGKATVGGNYNSTRDTAVGGNYNPMCDNKQGV